MKTSNLERIHLNKKDWLIYGVLPIGEDWKYLLIPVLDEVIIDEYKQPVDEYGNAIGTWTNQKAIDYARENKPSQLSINF